MRGSSSSGPAERRNVFKEVVRAAAILVKRRLGKGSAETVRERLRWAVLRHRASRVCDVRGARGAVEAWPALKRRCDDDCLAGDPASLNDCIARLQSGVFDQEELEVEADGCIEDEKRTAELKKIRKKRQLGA